MDTFQIGDKVCFLNDKGGGVVTRIVDSKTVMVETDGFEIPFLTSDLVIDRRSQPTKKHTANEIQKEIIQKEESIAKATEDARRGNLRRFASNAEEEGVYLAFVPHDQQWLLSGPLDVVLLNHTEADMYYNFILNDETVFKSVDKGEVAAHSKVIVKTISRDEIETWCNGIVQGIFTKKESGFAILPLNAPYSIRANRFFKEGSITLLNCLGEKAISICLSTYNLLKKKEADISGLVKNGIGNAVSSPAPTKKIAAIDKHKTAPCEAVVDLHIGELVDNILGLSSHDMFRIQMDYFRRMLDSAIENDYSKVTFIHGVGNGVLKNAIIDELKNSDNTTNRMASLAKFGVGAIDVIIKDKSK